jgi:hypothetical protein
MKAKVSYEEKNTRELALSCQNYKKGIKNTTTVTSEAIIAQLGDT